MFLSKKYIILYILVVCSVSVQSQHHLLNDEFDRPCSINDWNNINITEGWNAEQLELHNINQTNDGVLTMMPYTSSWYADYRGILLFKNISGNFILETTITATNKTASGLPSSDYSLAGLMIRTPKTLTNGATGWVSGMENYVFLAMGWAATNHPSCPGCPGPHFEVKNTTNSNSNLNISTIGSQPVTIRMLRINGVILVLRRTPGNPFTVHARFNRQDMPDQVQVGMVTYTDWPNVSIYNYLTQNSNVLNDDFDTNVNWNPDLIAQFEYARFDDVTIPGHLEGLNFNNPNTVADTAIINNFGYDLLPQSPWNGHVWKGVNSDWNDGVNWTNGIPPTGLDSLLIPDCSCPEMVGPILPPGIYNLGGLHIEEGGNVTLESGAQLHINLNSGVWRFINEGSIINGGQITITRPEGQEIINRGSIINQNGSSFNVIDP